MRKMHLEKNLLKSKYIAKGYFKFLLNTIPRPILIRMSYWVQPLLSFLLRGDVFEDPIDHKTFKRFLPYGYQTQRQNVLSPSTLSLERHRLLWLYLENETSFLKTTLRFYILLLNKLFINALGN